MLRLLDSNESKSAVRRRGSGGIGSRVYQEGLLGSIVYWAFLSDVSCIKQDRHIELFTMIIVYTFIIIYINIFLCGCLPSTAL